MKKTVYFIGKQQDYAALAKVIEDATDKRDEFVSNLSNNVAKIDSEDIKIVVFGNGFVNVVIQLTYYQK